MDYVFNSRFLFLNGIVAAIWKVAGGLSILRNI